MTFKLTRFGADTLLLIVAVVWGGAFVAQKTVLDHLGPLTFSALRFSIAAVFVIPFAVRELPAISRLTWSDWSAIGAIALTFSVGTTIQQLAMAHVSVTNAGFLTTTYVVLVPFVMWAIFSKLPNWQTLPAAAMSLAGVFLLGGGSFAALSGGDVAILVTAAIFAVQIAILGRVMVRLRLPATVALAQIAVIVLISVPLAAATETVTFQDITTALPELFYTGIISGGFAFLIQAVAQAHTPPTDAAIIMSSESLFSALFAAFLLGERLPLIGWTGCALILTAILLVELGPLIAGRATRCGRPQPGHPQGRG